MGTDTPLNSLPVAPVIADIDRGGLSDGMEVNQVHSVHGLSVFRSGGKPAVPRVP
jgi:hypothetical protein